MQTVELLLCLAEVILDLFTCRKRANHLRLKLANCDRRVGGPLHQIGPALAHFEHTVTMCLSCVAQAHEPRDLIAVALDRLELLGEASLHLLLVLLLVGQHFGLVDEAVDLLGVVLQVAQGGFELGNAGGGFGNAGRRRRAAALLLACGGPVAVSLGGDACPEIVLAFACGVTPGGQIERSTQRSAGKGGLLELGALPEPQGLPQPAIERLVEDRTNLVMSLAASELGFLGLEDLEHRLFLSVPALAVPEAVRARRHLDLDLGPYVLSDGLHGLDRTLAGIVALGEKQVDRLGKRGLADLVIALDDRDPLGGELDLDLADPTIVAEHDSVDPHGATTANR